MINRNLCYHEDHIPGDWRARTVMIWVEDDVPYIGKEHTDAAFRRITGKHESEKPVRLIDEGDAFYAFYRGGWVRAVECDGGWIGVLTV